MKTVNEIQCCTNKFRRKLMGKPVRENFGNKELRSLDDFIGNVYQYSYEDRLTINRITDNFFDWCVNYTGK